MVYASIRRADARDENGDGSAIRADPCVETLSGELQTCSSPSSG
jgi:hypothetical protein